MVVEKTSITEDPLIPRNKERAGIVFTLDRGYLRQLSVMLASIIDHADNKKTYDLIVYENTFTEKDRRQLKAQCPKNISLRFFDVTHRLKTDLKGITLYTRSWWTNAIWYKCLIPFVMRQYRQTLYLDVDAIIQTDIANLFDDQQNAPLAAVRDVLAYTIHRPENQKTAQYLKNIGLKHPENYFNAGVLRYNHALIDIDQYQQNLINAYTQKGPFNCPEQDLLNLLYQTNVTLMPFENNYQIQINPSQTFKQNYQKLEHKPLEQSSHNAKILHYFGAIKPWHLKTSVIEHFDTYWQYIKTSPYKHAFEQEAQQSQNQLVAQQKHPYRLRFNYIKAKLFSKLSRNEKKDDWEQQRQYYKNQLIKTKALKNLPLCALTDTDTPEPIVTPSRVSTPVKTGLTLEQAKQLLADNLTETQLLAHIENITFPEKTVAPIKTIAIFYPRLHQGGVERVISLQIPHYLKLGLTVILITALIDKEKDYPLDPRVIRITLPRNIEEGRIEQLQKICQKHTIDCFIHHDSSGPTILQDLILLNTLSIKTIVIRHQLTVQEMNHLNPRVAHYPKIYRLADQLIVLSTMEQTFYQTMGCHVQYIPNPIENHGHPIEDITQNQQILWIGRLERRQKNYHDALEIMKQVCTHCPKAQMILLGSEDHPGAVKEIKNYIQKNQLQNNIHWQDHTLNVDKYYRQTRIHLITSSYESFSMAIVESKTYGIPLVTYDMPYLEILKSGKGAIIVQQRNIQQAAQAIVQLLKNNTYCQKLAKEANESIQPFFAYNQTQAWHHLFQTLVQNKTTQNTPTTEQTDLKCFLNTLFAQYEIGCLTQQKQPNKINQQIKTIKYRILSTLTTGKRQAHYHNKYLENQRIANNLANRRHHV